MLMTTSKAPPIGDPGGMREGEAAALYRLMTWPVAVVSGRSVFLFQRDRVGGGAAISATPRRCGIGWPR